MFLKFCKALYILLCPGIWYCPYDHLSFDTKKENNKKVVINEILAHFCSHFRKIMRKLKRVLVCLSPSEVNTQVMIMPLFWPILENYDVTSDREYHCSENFYLISLIYLRISKKILFCLFVTSIFCDPTDCSQPVSSVHGVLQARIVEWVAISSSKGSSWPMFRTQVSCIEDKFLTVWATREAQNCSRLRDKADLVFQCKVWRN